MPSRSCAGRYRPSESQSLSLLTESLSFCLCHTIAHRLRDGRPDFPPTGPCCGDGSGAAGPELTLLEPSRQTPTARPCFSAFAAAFRPKGLSIVPWTIDKNRQKPIHLPAFGPQPTILRLILLAGRRRCHRYTRRPGSLCLPSRALHHRSVVNPPASLATVDDASHGTD